MPHTAGDAGWVAWTNGVDGSISALTASDALKLASTAAATSYDPLGAAAAAQAAAAVDASAKVGAVLGRPGLAVWRKARAAMGTAPARILCVGDSITEGGLSLSVTARWTSVLAGLIATRYAVPTSTLGYLTPFMGVTSTVNPLTVTNGTTEANWGVSCGNGTHLTASTGKITGTVVGSSLDIHYIKNTSTATFIVKIDGTQVGGAYGGTAGAVTDGFVQHVAMGASGSHTIEIDAGTATTGTYINGISVLNGNESSGVQMFNGGYSGALAVKFAVPNGVPWWQQALAGVSPHLVIMMWNPNDYAGATAMATYQTQLDTIIANIRTGVVAQPQPSILLVTPPKISYTSTQQWETYTHAMRTAAKKDGSAEFFDLGSLMPDIGSTAGNASGYYSADPTHPNAAGHARMAQIIDEVLGDALVA